MKKAPLIISISSPCSQDWNTMEITDQGRHCHQCDRIIHDFSQMTDAELLRSFTNGSKPCGRFHTSQLDRAIIPVSIKKSLFAQAGKIAATFLAMITLKNSPVKASGLPAALTKNAVRYPETFLNVVEDTLSIKGIVKDRNGIPINKAVVDFGNEKIQTNEKGEFSFAVPGNVAAINIYISFESLIPVVRNYHVAMGATSYDVVLYDRIGSSHTMGIAILPFYNTADSLTTVNFHTFNTTLTKAQRQQLSLLALEMKRAPGMNFNLTAYAKTITQRKNAQKRLDKIKLFLIEQEGISSDRLMQIIDETQVSSTIDFKIIQ